LDDSLGVFDDFGILLVVADHEHVSGVLAKVSALVAAYESHLDKLCPGAAYARSRRVLALLYKGFTADLFRECPVVSE
jgi:hypothetical protein